MAASDSAEDWARYWRADGVPVEAMHAHFTSHVYHRHSHESYSFGVTESGAQAFTCRHGRHVSAQGMVMAFNPDDPHDGHAAGDGGFTYRMVHIWPEFFASLTGTVRPLPLFGSPVLDDPVIARSLRRLHTALTGPASELERYERLSAAAALLVRHASGSGPAPDPPGAGSDPGLAARIRELIHDAGAAADLTAGDLAVAAGCSRYVAYRAFHQAYGLAPSDYQRQLRVRAARRLLSRGVPPAAAAAEAGFADQAHLTRWFRRYYGITPGAYRGAAHPQSVTAPLGGICAGSSQCRFLTGNPQLGPATSDRFCSVSSGTVAPCPSQLGIGLRSQSRLIRDIARQVTGAGAVASEAADLAAHGRP